jgi:hypothetical protein
VTVGKPARVFEYPLELVNPLNGGAIRTIAQQAQYRKLKREQHLLVQAGLRSSYGLKPPAVPLIVFMTRLMGPTRRKFDRQNLGTVFKAPIDAIAEWLGVDDDHPELRFELGQARHRFEGLRITFAKPERIERGRVQLIVDGAAVDLGEVERVENTFTITRTTA